MGFAFFVGFNTQTFLSPADMRKYIFPWHKRIVETAHRRKMPCILHSCGYYGEVIDDVIDDMRFDGRHSYEDNICPVEQAYEELHGRIAVLGGIDMDFMTRKTPAEIYARATAMLQRTDGRGGYLLGTGNSVPETIPYENYTALLRAAWDYAG
jgi:uroporphyrinogen decarboxylase